jgi:hypothetical protein
MAGIAAIVALKQGLVFSHLDSGDNDSVGSRGAWLHRKWIAKSTNIISLSCMAAPRCDAYIIAAAAHSLLFVTVRFTLDKHCLILLVGFACATLPMHCC